MGESRPVEERCAVSIPVPDQPIPLVTDADGVVRIGATRVTLDTLVSAFREGVTPESMVDQYPSLRLPDVYLVIGYFLTHKEEVETYLRGRQHLATEARTQNEARFPPDGIRDRLLARRAQG
jgi:uncharacterized protein (DUF433 family)